MLQNENGPCPLLAAANCLLLKGTITLPSNIVGAGVVTIDQLVNVLAEKILANQKGGPDSDHHVQEVLTIFPSLQFGMDVNPKFTAGPTGVEYTMHLNAFDLLHIELVHGWLLEPDAPEYEFIGSLTYNQLVNAVIEGNDAEAALDRATDGQELANREDLSTKATKGSVVKLFLDRSAHQLTQYGLTVLHEYMQDGQMFVFFRNNHFNTITKHEGLLYLLVTDFGYANVGSVVWEKLDVIDGDTEYVTSDFKPPPAIPEQLGAAAASPEQLIANDLQSQADYQLALQLSQETSGASTASAAAGPSETLLSQDSELEAAKKASLDDFNKANPNFTAGLSNVAITGATTPSVGQAAAQKLGVPSALPPTVAVGVPAAPPSQEDQDMMFALQLQRQEERESVRRAQAAAQRGARPGNPSSGRAKAGGKGDCIIS